MRRVAFEVEGPLERFLNCHCSGCRKATGTAHSCEVIVESLGVALAQGRSICRPLRPASDNELCHRVLQDLRLSYVHLTHSGREAIIDAGTLDEPLGVAPDRHVHWSSRADWYVPGEGLPAEERAAGGRL